MKRFGGKKSGQYDEFEVEAGRSASIVNALNTIQREIDSTLAFRKNCRRGSCGICAMRINGVPKLACETLVEKEMKANGKIVLEPLSEDGVICDLVVDEKVFWQKIHASEPWLVCEKKKNFSMSKAQVESLSNVSDCIYCGICVETCKVNKLDSNFLGPAALALCFKLAADPRDEATKKRLERAVEGGLWSCTRAFKCVQNCPKKVEPAAAIEKLRALSMKHGISHGGAKYAKNFAEAVEKTGKFDESTVVVKTLGLGNAKRKLSLALRLLLHGKLPLPRIAGIKKIESVRKAFKKKT